MIILKKKKKCHGQTDAQIFLTRQKAQAQATTKK